MEDSSTTHHIAGEPAEAGAARRKRRRVTILGVLLRFLVAVLILAAAGYGAYALIQSRPEGITRQARERSFTVIAAQPDYGTFSTSFIAYGSVIMGRDIAIRAQVQGEIVEVAPDLAEGALVEKGTLLAAIDSYDYDGALIDARAALADAQLSLSEAEENLKLQQSKLETARASLDIAQRDFERATALNKSGTLTDKELETRQLALNERRQAISELETGIFSQNATIDRRRVGILDAQSGIEQAQRNLANTKITAPFTGVVVSENLGLGAYVTKNETLVTLYDQDDLQVRFTISDQQYGKLVADGLTGRDLTARWTIGPETITVPGTITRTGAEVDSTTGGVTLYGRLRGEDAHLLRPGTFVEVEIDGPDYENSLRVPETAIYENDHLYVIRDGRMARIEAKILTRDNEMLIVEADIPEGERIITSRLAQAGEGVRVLVEGEARQAPQGPGASGSGAGQLPPGAVRRDDGSVELPNGNIRRPDGSIERPDGTVISAEDARKLREQRRANQGG